MARQTWCRFMGNSRLDMGKFDVFPQPTDVDSGMRL